MASEDMGLVQAQQQPRLDNGLGHPQLAFQDSSYGCDPPPAQRRAAASAANSSKATTRELTGGFIDHHHYFHQPTPADFRRTMFSSTASATGDRPQPDRSHDWNLGGRASTTPRGDGSEDEDDDEVEDEEEEGDDNDGENEAEAFVRVDIGNLSTDKTSDRNKMGYQKSKQHPSFGMKEGSFVGRSDNTNDDDSNCDMRNAVTIANADGEQYYSQYMQGTVEVGPQKDAMVAENGCGFSGRKEGLYLSESGESLRAILSDPLTGALMDDAMILPCGHSFGCGGMQHILRMKSCYTCSKTVSEDSASPNLSLRAAVQAFRREEEMHVHRVPKRRRDQDKGTYGDTAQTEYTRGRGVQFPFSVNDRVIIKGNKRTPPRFVGREAIVTSQCLNGWYVVKTLDNAESVKLQYRSLAKVPDNSSPKAIPNKMTPNWL